MFLSEFRFPSTSHYLALLKGIQANFEGLFSVHCVDPASLSLPRLYCASIGYTAPMRAILAALFFGHSNTPLFAVPRVPPLSEEISCCSRIAEKQRGKEPHSGAARGPGSSLHRAGDALFVSCEIQPRSSSKKTHFLYIFRQRELKKDWSPNKLDCGPRTHESSVIRGPEAGLRNGASF